MAGIDKSILLIGESGVGKTHYGAQLLKRLMQGDGQLRMKGAATNLDPFDAAMKSLDEGMAAEHTPTSTYMESVWPITDDQGRTAELVWPDYGGEQVKAMIATRRIPNVWRSRITLTPAWALLVRLNQTRVADDIFSRPLLELKGSNTENRAAQLSDQARLVELLQMLLYSRGGVGDGLLYTPRFAVLLTCWDELTVEGRPTEVLRQRLPMFLEFVESNWARPIILGLSALGRSLRRGDRDMEYAARGPECFGYVVTEDGKRSLDLTLPIKLLLSDAA